MLSIQLMMLDNDLNNILWDQDRRNPIFDLQTIEIPQNNFDPKTPVDIINKDLENVKLTRRSDILFEWNKLMFARKFFHIK